jgi:hypothetical protein
MCKRFMYLTTIFMLTVLCTSYTSAGIIYVDATEGEGGNTTLATGEIFEPVDVGTSGSGADGLWRWRQFANEGTIFEAGGSWEADLNTEDCPRLATSIEVPEGDYIVYVYLWADSAQWRIQASMENLEGDMPLYLANDPNGEATMAVAEDFEEPVPMLAEGNRTLWQVELGTTGVTTAINVYVDDDPNHLTGNSRTWYDGIGYQLAVEPVTEPINPGNEGLVAAYLMEGDVLDSSGNELHGTIVGDPNFIDGAIGMALDLDGDGDYVDCGNDPKFDVNEQVTVATWVNIRTLPQAWNAVITKGDAAWRISTNGATSGMHFGFEDGTRGWQAANSATELNMGEWYHVCGVYDTAVGAKIYINGVEDGSNPDTEGITFSTWNVYIGANAQTAENDDPRCWDGGIDEVMIYNRALSEAEVLYLATPPQDPGTEGLLAYYPLDGDVIDASGNGNDGVIMGDPGFVDGIAGQALDLDGDGDYIDCGAAEMLGMQETNAMTAASWVTIRSIPAAWSAVVAKGEYAWRISNANMDPRFHFGITIWNAPDTFGTDGVTAVGLDEWHHVAGTFDGANINLYVDGVLDINVTTTEPIGANEANVLIGENPESAGRYWDGLIDEVVIYNRALSDAEIAFLAQ